MNTDFLQITTCGVPNMKPRCPVLLAPRASHCTTAAIPATLARVRPDLKPLTTHPSRPRSHSLRRSRASAQNQLRREDRLHTGRSASEEDELLRPHWVRTPLMRRTNSRTRRSATGYRLHLLSMGDGFPRFLSTHLSDLPGRDKNGHAGEERE